MAFVYLDPCRFCSLASSLHVATQISLRGYVLNMETNYFHKAVSCLVLVGIQTKHGCDTIIQLEQTLNMISKNSVHVKRLKTCDLLETT